MPGDQQHMIKLNAELAKKLAEHHQAQAGAARCRRVEGQDRQARRADPVTRDAWNRKPTKRSRKTAGSARRPDRDRCRHRRRRPGRPVPGVRARPARDQGAHHRLARLPRRPVHRALSRQADLRHPGRAGVHRQGADRQPAQADRAVRRDLPPRPGSDAWSHKQRRRPLRRRDHRKGTRFLTKTIFIAGGVGSFQPRTAEGRRPRQVRRHAAVLPRAQPGAVRRQEPRHRRRRRLGARLGAELRAGRPEPGRERDPGAPARRLPRRAGQRGADEGAVRRARDAVHRRPGHRHRRSRRPAHRRARSPAATASRASCRSTCCWCSSA